MAVVLFLIGGLLPLSGLADASGGVIEPDPQLARHIAEAVDNNPDLAGRRAEESAARERIPQAGAWSDPMVTFGLMNLPVNSFDPAQEAMTGTWVTLSQMVPLTGKFSVKRAVARRELERIMSGRSEGEFQVAEAVMEGWYDWAYLRSATATLDTTIALLDDLLRITRRKYETGRGLQQDILRAETERTRLEDRRAELAQRTLTAGRRFATLLGREPGEAPDPPAGIDVRFTPLSLEELAEKLTGGNPTLEKVRAALAASEEKVELAERLWWPDLKLSAGYGYRRPAPGGVERPDFFTATAGITLPIFGASKQAPAVQEARALARRMQAVKRDVELRLRLRLESLLDEDTRLERQIELYTGGVLPQAEATLAAATASYTVGRADFEALLMAETALHNARLQRLARIRDRAKVRAALAALVGETWMTGKNEPSGE